MNKNIVIGIVVVVILVVIGFMSRNGSTSKNSELIVGKNAININEQALGKKVKVSFVVLEKNGFVVIHEMLNNVPGKVIGISDVLSTGRTDNVEFFLSESLRENKNYTAMLHFDDDGNGFLNINKDSVVKEDKEGGSPIMMEFKASVNGGADSISI